jgi:hypothetical protein
MAGTRVGLDPSHIQKNFVGYVGYWKVLARPIVVEIHPVIHVFQAIQLILNKLHCDFQAWVLIRGFLGPTLVLLRPRRTDKEKSDRRNEPWYFLSHRLSPAPEVITTLESSLGRTSAAQFRGIQNSLATLFGHEALHQKTD